MARVVLTAVLWAASVFAQSQPDTHLKQAGVCARCHVISVVEWGMSAHTGAATGCVACHGESQGHVIDERNNIKPDRIPHGAAIAGLCAQCHTAGCPGSKQKAACETCHHVHALVDSRKAPTAADPRLEARAKEWSRGESLLAEAAKLAQAGQYPAAAGKYREAAGLLPGDERARAGLLAAENRLRGNIPGFDPPSAERDAATGLPKRVRVAQLGFEMALVPGGEFEMGSESRPASRPVHTRRAAPFYLATHEVTVALWKSVMGEPAPQGLPAEPVRHVSWTEAQAFLRKLNATVPGASFRLPTEEEWECAARANNPSGAAPDDSVCSRHELLRSPRPAGSGKPGLLGLYDMQGNVWEWCSSLAAPYPYEPADGRERLDAPGHRVLRGGGFGDSADLLDLSLRHTERPDRKLQSNGFRVARSLPAR